MSEWTRPETCVLRPKPAFWGRNLRFGSETRDLGFGPVKPVFGPVQGFGPLEHPKPCESLASEAQKRPNRPEQREPLRPLVPGPREGFRVRVFSVSWSTHTYTKQAMWLQPMTPLAISFEERGPVCKPTSGEERAY